MNGESNIDVLFHQRLNNAEVPPPVEVWPKIAAEIRQKRRRRVFFWFWFAGLGTLGMGLWFSTVHGPLGAAKPAQTNPSIKTKNLTATPASSTIDTGANTNIAALEASGATKGNKLLSNNRSTTTSSGQNTPKGVVPDPAIGTLLSVKPLPLPGRTEVEKSTPASPSSPDPNEEDRTVALARTPSGALVDDFPRLPSLDFVDLQSALKQPLTKTARIIKKKKEKKKCYDFHKNSSAWLLDVYAGPSIAQKMLRTTPDNLPYLNKRLNSEHRDWATFNLGVRATYLFKRHFLLRTGLHYDHSTELFHFSVLDHIEYKIKYDPVTGIKDSSEFKEIYNETKTFNRFSMLEIPVMGGFELRSGNMGVNINAGTSLNLFFGKRGQILSPDNKPSWFTPSDQQIEVFRPRTGFSFMGSAQWFWHLQPRLRVYVEPYFRQVLQPISVATHPIEQRHRMWGLNLGVTRILD